ncbi:tRNA (adenosine(37)-N6)-dimethylallyltransferase MiaA [Patescibacteria group bacterium]|nr:tRNA (adenosine(37)-N6)-dimethylallyltransferase MiaA [Patescibacteria group bacterium]
MDLDLQKLLVILGPTSLGKTDLALQLAKKLNGELVSCDSRQVYKKLDIGTGKMPGEKVEVAKGRGFWEMDGIKVWMHDVADPNRQYTVYDYVKDANRAVEDTLNRGKLPIIVGGTGFYLKALLEGLSNLSVPANLKLRKHLESLSLKEMQKKIEEISSQKWGKMNNSDRQNPRRLVRAIEVVLQQPQKIRQINSKLKNCNILKIGLTAPRAVLYKRIDDRVVDRLDQGLIEEVEQLYKDGLSLERMKQLGLEYGVLADYLERKNTNREELIKRLQGKIHGFARRQITWFKKEKNTLWFDITDKNYLVRIEKTVRKWYDT